MTRRASFILALALTWAGCVTTPPTPESLQVDGFDIEGENKLKEGDIKEKLVTGESSCAPNWVPFFGHSEWFDPTTWEADLRRIQRFYEANGFYQARVLEDVVTQVRPNHVKLLVRLREGEAARIGSLDIRGLEALSPQLAREVLDELPLSKGDIFLEDSWARTKVLLSQRLRERGFAEAAIAGEALVDAEAARVDLALTITPGIRYRLGKTRVVIQPDALVPERLIADVVSPELPEGGYFSDSALADAQARVFKMGVFAGVKVSADLPDQSQGTVPVRIEVREAPFHAVRLGVGLGGDLIRQEARLIGEYTDRNLGFSRLFSKEARLDRLTLKAKVGLAVLEVTNEALRHFGLTWRAHAEYEVPRIFELRTLSLQGSLDALRALESAYDYYSLETKLGVIWRPGADVTVFPSLNLNTFWLQTAIERREAAPLEAINCPLAPQLCLVSFLNLNVELDRRDNPLEAKDGYYLALNAGAGLSSTSTLRPFWKLTPEARGYVSFGNSKQFTFAARLKMGTLWAPEGDTPIVVRYFSGGSSMRGFQERRLSPRVAVPTLNPAVELASCAGEERCPKIAYPNYDRGTTLPVGGAGLFEAAAEVRWSVAENWVLAAFNDWGLVTSQALFAGQDWGRSLYASLGLGIRYRTPLGPIRLDLAFRLPLGGPLEVSNTAHSDGGAVRQFESSPGCFFGLGSGQPLGGPRPTGAEAGAWAGSPDNVCNLHLSLGEAF